MRITVIGPTFPWRGGIPLLVTDLAHRLTAAGHRVTLRTWTRQGPARLLPAQRHPLRTPEAGVLPDRPGATVLAEPGALVADRAGGRAPSRSWWCWCTTPRCKRWPWPRSPAAPGRRPRVVLICANAVPHESRPGDRRLLALLAGSVHAILVHTRRARAVSALTDRPVAVAALPPHLPAGAPRATAGAGPAPAPAAVLREDPAVQGHRRAAAGRCAGSRTCGSPWSARCTATAASCPR